MKNSTMKLYDLLVRHIVIIAASSTLSTSSPTNETLTFHGKNLLHVNQDGNNSASRPSQAETFLHCTVYCNESASTEHGPTGCAKSVCRKCDCDKYCKRYGDCCDLNELIRVNDQNRYECVVSKEGSHYIAERGQSYYMVTKCPVGSSLDVMDVSQTLPDEISPVTSLSTNITYINDKISECHNDNIHITWNKERHCDNGADYISEDQCGFKISPPDDLPVRECQHFNFSNLTYIDTCNSTGTATRALGDGERECKNEPYQPIVADNHVFKNLHCYLCNGLSSLVAPCSRPAVIMRFSINILVRTKYDHCPLKCKKTQWYDRLKNVCRYIICRKGYELAGQQCVMKSLSLSDIQYHVKAEFWPQESPPDPELENWEFVKSMVAQNLFHLQNVFNISSYVFTIYNIYPVEVKGGSKDMPSFRLQWIFRTKQNCCRDEFEQQLSVLMNSWTFIYNGSSYTFDLLEENLNYYRLADSQTYKTTSSDTSGVVKASKENIYLPTVYPNCSFVFLWNDDDITLKSDNSVTLTYASITLPPADFIMKYETHQLIICLDSLKEIYKHYPPFDPLKYAEEIASLFFSILSLICLTLTFVTYCKFSSLRTLPTTNTMCLVIHLFVAQVLLLFKGEAIGDDIACKVIGVLLHYSWLSVIFWMNVCSFHMFYVFVISATKPINTESHRVRQLQYFAYAHGSSLVIVVITISAKLGTTSGGEFGYGSCTCYLSSALLTGVSFILPLGIILIMNIIFFSISVWTMAKIHMVTETVGHEKSQVHIYMKLSTLTGIFWVLSILAERLDQWFLVFMSVILNASQGVFIFISYMVNKRVYQLWKAQFSQYAVFARGQSTESTNESPM